MAAAQSSSETVCVTGANGFIGSWIVRTLLARGYVVHGAHQPGTATDHLLDLPSAAARLLLFPADLLDPAAVRLAVAGCSGVFHVASPCTLDSPRDPEAELIRPAVEGTINVLEAAVAAGGVRRVVITASISSLIPNPGWPHHIKPVDESSWTDLDYCKTHKVMKRSKFPPFCAGLMDTTNTIKMLGRRGIHCRRRWRRRQGGSMQRSMEWTL